MPEGQVTIYASLLIFTKRDEVVGVKLKFRIQMEWSLMMNIDLHLTKAYKALRMLLEIRSTHLRPLLAPLLAMRFDLLKRFHAPIGGRPNFCLK